MGIVSKALGGVTSRRLTRVETAAIVYHHIEGLTYRPGWRFRIGFSGQHAYPPGMQLRWTDAKGVPHAVVPETTPKLLANILPGTTSVFLIMDALTDDVYTGRTAVSSWHLEIPQDARALTYRQVMRCCIFLIRYLESHELLELFRKHGACIAEPHDLVNPDLTRHATEPIRLARRWERMPCNRQDFGGRR